MSSYTVTIYEGATIPEQSVSQMFFTFDKDDLEQMISFIDMVMEHSTRPINILIES